VRWIGRARAHWRRRAGYRRLGSSFAIIFGTIWLFLEPVSLIFPKLFEHSWQLLVALVLVSLLGGLWRSRPRKRLEFKLPPSDLKIAIAVGDVLAQEGNIVLGSNDTFDTSLSNDIISPQSVQGQLLQRSFGGDQRELNSQIDSSLAEVAPIADPEKTFGKTDRYPIGTVAIATKGNARYFLPAIARMSASTPPHTKASVEGVQMALTKAWEAVGRAGQRDAVHAPIVGSHLARLGLSHTWLVQMMVLSFVAVTKKEGGSSSLTIWVAENDATTVDLAAIDDWLRALCAT
jgi:hypothetical protein